MAIGISKYHSDHSPDLQFGNEGQLIFAPEVPVPVFSSAFVQSDGSLLIGNSNPQNELVRLGPNGVLDKSFGTDGKLVEEIGVQKFFGLSDDAIYSFVRTYDSSTLKRFSKNGLPDSSFALTTFPFVSTTNTFVGLYQAADAMAYIAFGAYVGNDRMPQLSVARILPQGGLDTSFGTNGVTTILVPNGSVFDFEDAIQVSDAIYFVTSTVGTSDAKLFRMRLDGTLDGAFGTGGMATIPSFTSSNDTFLTVDHDAGAGTRLFRISRSELGTQLWSVHLGPSGAVDTSYGQNGYNKIPWWPSILPESLTPDGDMLLVLVSDYTYRLQLGVFLDSSGALVLDSGNVVSVRASFAGDYSSTGLLGHSWVPAGIGRFVSFASNRLRLFELNPKDTTTPLTERYVDFSTSETFVQALSDSNGSIYIVSQEEAVARIRKYTPKLTIDTSFGTAGTLVVPMASITLHLQFTTQGSDFFFSRIEFENGIATAKVSRFDRYGAPILDFGTQGTISFGCSLLDRIIVVDADTILWVARQASGSVNLYSVLRNGTIDPNFQVIDFVSGNLGVYGVNFVKDGKGRIISRVTTPNYTRINRIEADGSLDPSFGSQGSYFVSTSFQIPDDSGIAMVGDEILIAFYATEQNYTPGVMALNSHGALDPAFSNNGIVLLEGGASSTVAGLSVLADGSVVLNTTKYDNESSYGYLYRLKGPDVNPRPLHNVDTPMNVDGSPNRSIDPLDVLTIVNRLNGATNQGTVFPDVDADGFVSPLDALAVINFLNSRGGEGEGESELATDQSAAFDWANYSNDFDSSYGNEFKARKRPR